GFFVVHGHAGESFADVSRRGDGIGVAVRTFRVHIDQTHLHRSKRILEIAIAGVTLVAQPCVFRTPINVVIGLPAILATSAKAESFESHRLEGDLAGQNHQVGPRYLATILLFDRPEQTAGFIKAHVIRPTVKWCEALLTPAATSAAVPSAI